MRRLLISILLLGAACAPSAAPAQEAPPPILQPHAQVFAGYVTEFSPTAISVSRKNASGKEMVHKSFSINEHTKVEGKIKLNARVTVQFLVDADSNNAVRVIVRAN